MLETKDEHGGALCAAARKYGIPVQDWLDLSTGINPNAYPVPNHVPREIWRRLPESQDGLIETAQAYYNCKHCVAVAGSQSAIRALPYLRPRGNVAVPRVGYQEHGIAWRTAGHQVIALDAHEIEQRLTDLDVLVLIRPNNPTGETLPIEVMLRWVDTLEQRQAWLVVDEAFIDAQEDPSLTPYADRQGLIVLRSIGKFFGLAGVRLGFAISNASLCERLRQWLGPWCVNGPARWIAQVALTDHAWQCKAREELTLEHERLIATLSPYLQISGGTRLFQWARTAHAAQWHRGLAELGVLTRFFSEPLSIRFGLPMRQHWERLNASMRKIAESMR